MNYMDVGLGEIEHEKNLPGADKLNSPHQTSRETIHVQQ
jgi:hypothetical protein